MLEEGEKATRFFFGLERKRASRNLVSSIYDENGVEVFSREEIERAHVAFYTKVFSEEPIDECYKQMCFDNIGSTLSPDQRDSCEGELTLSELTSSVNSLSLNRSPGLDGLTVEFYRHFWHLLGPLLLQVACECLRQGSLTNSMKGSITRLIFKKRGDKKDLKNWRPISLLNVDYLSNRPQVSIVYRLINHAGCR